MPLSILGINNHQHIQTRNMLRFASGNSNLRPFALNNCTIDHLSTGINQKGETSSRFELKNVPAKVTYYKPFLDTRDQMIITIARNADQRSISIVHGSKAERITTPAGAFLVWQLVQKIPNNDPHRLTQVGGALMLLGNIYLKLCISPESRAKALGSFVAALYKGVPYNNDAEKRKFCTAVYTALDSKEHQEDLPDGPRLAQIVNFLYLNHPQSKTTDDAALVAFHKNIISTITDAAMKTLPNPNLNTINSEIYSSVNSPSIHDFMAGIS